MAALPRRVVPIHGETLASYLWRLTERNGMAFQELARHIGAPRMIGQADPQIEEVRLGPVAQQRLAQVSGRSVGQLERALPSWAHSRISARVSTATQFGSDPLLVARSRRVRAVSPRGGFVGGGGRIRPGRTRPS
jgi:hypothetical protein